MKDTLTDREKFRMLSDQFKIEVVTVCQEILLNITNITDRDLEISI